jgi:methionine synthase I (cobalamin-dependent)
MNYQNGKIYKIVSQHTDNIYVGSTCSPLYKRLYEHKKNFKSFLNGKYHYTSSFDILKFGDCDILLIENYPCESRDELHAREGHYIKSMKCANKRVAGRSKKTYYEDKKDELSLAHRKYYDKNKECLKKRQNEYYNDNKPDQLQRMKKYYSENKANILERNKQAIQCECGKTYLYNHKSRHTKTKFHQKFMEAHSL